MGPSCGDPISIVKFWLWVPATTGGAATTKPIAKMRATRPGSSAQRVARPHSRIKPLRVLMPRKLALDMSNCRGWRVPESELASSLGSYIAKAASTRSLATFSAPLAAAGGAPLPPESRLSALIVAVSWRYCDGVTPWIDKLLIKPTHRNVVGKRGH